MVLSHRDLAKKLNELEKRVGTHDAALRQVIEAIRQLMSAPTTPKPKRKIGFDTSEE